MGGWDFCWGLEGKGLGCWWVEGGGVGCGCVIWECGEGVGRGWGWYELMVEGGGVGFGCVLGMWGMGW